VVKRMYSIHRYKTYPSVIPLQSTTVSKIAPRHLVPRIGNVYKSWGKGGFYEKYDMEGELGQGNFGTVYAAKSKAYGTHRVVKKIDKSDVDPDITRDEINALLNVDHPHIVQLIRWYEEETNFYLVFELCSGPSLHDTIVKGIESQEGRMSEHNVAVALRHMLKAVKYCHAKFMGHYDIKPENFMYRSPHCTNLKMIDLGTSTTFVAKSNVVKGSDLYIAPEIYQGIYGPEADVWSCGIVLFAMLTGEFVFDEDEIVKLVHDRQYIKDRVKWASEQGISSEAHCLLQQMLVPDRHMRITVSEALQHSFILRSYEKDLHDSVQQRQALAVLESLEQNLRNFSTKPILTRAVWRLTAHLVAHNQDDATFDAMHPQRLAFRMLDNLLYCTVCRNRSKADITPEMIRREGIGELSVGALEQALKMCGISVPTDLQELFQFVDADTDGYIGFGDFLSATLPPSVLSNDAHYWPVFTFLDRDGDGFIDASDLIDALGCRTEKEMENCHLAIQEVCQCKRFPGNGKQRLSFDEFLHALSKEGMYRPESEPYY